MAYFHRAAADFNLAAIGGILFDLMVAMGVASCGDLGEGHFMEAYRFAGNALDDFRAGDTVIVDWDKLPDPGTIGAQRLEDSSVHLVRYSGGAGAWGRLVRPAEVLRN